MSTLLFDTIHSPIGCLSIIFTDKGIGRIEIGRDPKHPPAVQMTGHASNTIEQKSMAPAWKRQFENYFQGKPVIFNIPLDIFQGTIFRKKVWKTLQKIPYGETRSYRWVAQQMGMPRAPRAVGQANAKNPIPIIIPCHRVIRSDGSLGGFSCGINIKKALLDLEGAYCLIK